MIKNIPTIFFLILIAFVLTGVGYLILPFTLPLILAILVAHFFLPLKTWLCAHNWPAVWATLVTFLTALLLVIGPLVGVSILVSNEARNFYQLISTNLLAADNNFYTVFKQTTVMQLLEQSSLLQWVEGLFSDQQLQTQLLRVANSAVSWLVNALRSFLVNLPTFVIHVFLWIYLTYFLLQDGKNFFERFKNFLPIAKSEQDKILTEVIKMMDATLIGTLLIGIIEGILGGIIFALADIPGAITWGVLMAILSMIPIVGANGILLPASIYYFVIGKLGLGFFILGAGTGTIMVIEYILKPRFMGSRAGVHPAIVAMTILGGIYRMGLLGFVVGPVLATIAIALLEIFRRRLLKNKA